MNQNEEQMLMSRPKNISVGDIPLTANLLELRIPSLELCHYAVSIEPTVARRLVPIIVNNVFVRHAEELSKISYGYDGRALLVTSKKLKEDIVEAEKIGSKEVTVKFEFKNLYGINDTSGMQCLEILLRSYQAKKFLLDGKKVVSQAEKAFLSGGIEVWYGLSQRVKFFNDKFFLNVDVAHSAFYESLSLLQVIEKQQCRRRGDYVDYKKLDVRVFRDLSRFLKNLRLTTVHRKNNFKFKATDITETSAFDTFFGDDKMSVSEYFEKQYGALRHPYLPCIVVRKKDSHIYFPLEVVKVVDGQKYTKKLNDFQTSEMIRMVSKPASDRFNSLEKRIQSLEISQNETLLNLNVQVQREFLQIFGKQLLPPEVKFQSGSVKPMRGSWNLRNQRVVKGVAVFNWSVLLLSDENTGAIKRGMQNFMRICTDMGLKIANPKEIRRCSIENIEQYMNGLDLVFVILHDRSSSVYQEIKRIADINCRVVTQCIRRQNLEKLNDGSFCGNLVLKINSKLGGSNFKIPRTDDDLIIFGCDVTHPGMGDMSSHSIAAVVSSLNNDFTKYHTSMKMQPRRQDIIEDLKEITKEHLQRYRMFTKKVPKKIMFFRDGIGESSMQTVYFREIESIKAAFKELNENYAPALTFVIVQKKHSVRFKGDGKNEQQRDSRRPKTCNPQPGTLVDSLGTQYNDFYLISHFALQGTPCPIKYHVLIDEINIQDFPQFIYEHCHIFSRATKTVSVVPPVYYAHLAAARAKCYVENDKLLEVDEKLKDVLWYL